MTTQIPVFLRTFIAIGTFVFFFLVGFSAYDFSPIQIAWTEVFLGLYGFYQLAQRQLGSKYPTGSAVGVLIADIALATVLIYWTGREQSMFTTIYFLPILSASFSFGLFGGIFTAGALSFVFLLLMIVGHPGPVQWFTGINHILAFLTIGLMSSLLSTRLQAARKTIRNLEDINRAIINNISSGIILFDSNKRIVSINPSASGILGLQKGDHELLFGRFREKLELRETQSEERPIVHYQHPDKGIRDLGYSIVRLPDPTGSGDAALLFSFQDLTRIHQIQQQLFTSKKLAAIGSLAASIAHEIRNPLASISGCVELLSKHIKEEPEAKKLTGIVLKETDRLNKLIGEFLNYVGKDQLAKTKTDLRILIDEVVESVRLRTDFSPQIQMTFKRPSESCFCDMDVNKIKQALLNIVINALQSLNGSGRLAISLQMGNPFHIVSIQDTGSGISKEHLEKIFEPFFTTKKGGTGLGLAMTQKIIEQHEGKISVESELNRGTEFKIWIPSYKGAS